MKNVMIEKTVYKQILTKPSPVSITLSIFPLKNNFQRRNLHRIGTDKVIIKKFFPIIRR